jgi:hypothetical protein
VHIYTGALSVLNQRIYHPENSMLEAILKTLPEMLQILASDVDDETKINVCRILVGFGDHRDNPGMILKIIVAGALPLLSRIYQVGGCS